MDVKVEGGRTITQISTSECAHHDIAQGSFAAVKKQNESPPSSKRCTRIHHTCLSCDRRSRIANDCVIANIIIIMIKIAIKTMTAITRRRSTAKSSSVDDDSALSLLVEADDEADGQTLRVSAVDTA